MNNFINMILKLKKETFTNNFLKKLKLKNIINNIFPYIKFSFYSILANYYEGDAANIDEFSYTIWVRYCMIELVIKYYPTYFFGAYFRKHINKLTFKGFMCREFMNKYLDLSLFSIEYIGKNTVFYKFIYDSIKYFIVSLCSNRDFQKKILWELFKILIIIIIYLIFKINIIKLINKYFIIEDEEFIVNLFYKYKEKLICRKDIYVCIFQTLRETYGIFDEIIIL